MIDEEIFKPIPGYENLYAISEYGQIKHLKFNRLKTTTITKRGQEVVVLFKDAISTTYTVSSLVKLTWKGQPLRKHPSHSKCKRIKCEETDQLFDSYKECCQELGFCYRQFLEAMKQTNEYHGYRFVKID